MWRHLASSCVISSTNQQHDLSSHTRERKEINLNIAFLIRLKSTKVNLQGTARIMRFCGKHFCLIKLVYYLYLLHLFCWSVLCFLQAEWYIMDEVEEDAIVVEVVMVEVVKTVVVKVEVVKDEVVKDEVDVDKHVSNWLVLNDVPRRATQLVYSRNVYINMCILYLND